MIHSEEQVQNNSWSTRRNTIEKSAAHGVILTHDTLLSRQNAVPTELYQGSSTESAQLQLTIQAISLCE